MNENRAGIIETSKATIMFILVIGLGGRAKVKVLAVVCPGCGFLLRLPFDCLAYLIWAYWER